MPERYNTQQEYAEYHIMQVSLYARFSPPFKRPEKMEKIEKVELINRENNISNSNSNSSSNSQFDESKNNKDAPSSSSSKTQSAPFSPFVPIGSILRQKEPDSDFLTFLKTSIFVPLDFALKECERRKPPLYLEMIFVLGRLGESVCVCLCERERER